MIDLVEIGFDWRFKEVVSTDAMRWMVQGEGEKAGTYEELRWRRLGLGCECTCVWLVAVCA